MDEWIDMSRVEREKRADEFRSKMVNMVNHYQNIHTNCDVKSECHRPNYLPSRDIIHNKKAAAKLTETLKKSKVYEFADGMLLGFPTSDCESINNTMSAYIEKRICFETKVYNLRSGIVVLHWNENVKNRGTRKNDYHYMQEVLTGYFENLTSL